MSTPTADYSDVRATNLSAVLGFLRANAPCSRAAIAGGTGLNKATITNIVGGLIDRRLIRETEQTQNKIGRPATLLELDGSTYAAIGMEISARGLTAIAYDAAGGQILRWHRSGPGRGAGPDKTLTATSALARRAMAAVEATGRQILGLTVGVPGLVDRDGTVVLAAGLGWRDFALKPRLLDALSNPSFPVTVDNDANLSALAEYRYGPFAGTSNLIQISGDTGLGAGVIADGRPLQGNLGYVGEVGHLRVAPDGPLCGCGRRGCLEAVAGIPALVRRLNDDSDLDDLQLAVEQVVARAAAGDGETVKALLEAGSWLGQGVAMLANVLNPALIVLGGYYATLGEWLLPAVEKELHEQALAPGAGGCAVALSTLGHDITAIGAVARSLDQLDAGRIPG
ncbi:ROK family protein [Kribbella sp. NBC_01505]|uniref:ROK family protein n=1 Tax=Kribbella sp. NBC_01505 TaxID=2903580 RepID=UPI00386D7226